MVTLSIPAGLAMVATPVIVTAFLGEQLVTPAQATLLGSCELGAMTVALILSSFVLGQCNRRLLAGWAAGAAAIGHIALAAPGSFPQFLACQTIAGLGEGGMAAVAVAAIAGTSSPDRNFAINILGNLVSSTLFFAAFPHVMSINGIRSIEWLLGLLALVFGLGIPWLPPHALVTKHGRNGSGAGVNAPAIRWPAVMGLFGTLLFLVAIGCVWPVVGKLGANKGLPAPLIATALTVAGLFGVLSALFATWLGVRAGRLIPLTTCSIGIMGMMFALLGALGSWEFVVAVVLFMFFWILAIPYFFGLLAALDASGRLVAFSTAMQTTGLSAGQAISAFFVGRAAFSSTIVIGIVMTACAMGTTLLAVRLQARQ
jgi:predicted MFS family arabinose efflux permease